MKYWIIGACSFAGATALSYLYHGNGSDTKTVKEGAGGVPARISLPADGSPNFSDVLAKLAESPEGKIHYPASLDELLKCRPRGAQSRSARRELVATLLKEWGGHDRQAAAQYIMAKTGTADVDLQLVMVECGAEMAPALMLAGLDNFGGVLACDVMAASLKKLPDDLPETEILELYNKCAAAHLPPSGTAAELWVRHYGERNPRGLAAIAEAGRESPAGSALLSGAVKYLMPVDLARA